jgi:hypothetical protein
MFSVHYCVAVGSGVMGTKVGVAVLKDVFKTAGVTEVSGERDTIVKEGSVVVTGMADGS